MKITEVRIFPTESKDGKLKAFATMTFDDWFVVRNVKVIQGNNGLFVAMPSRKAMDSCQKCRFKNVIGSKYCNQCGAQLEQKQASEEGARESYGSHMDIAHPITQECREYIQEQILDAYNKQSAQQPSEGSAPEAATSDNVSVPANEASSGESQGAQDQSDKTVEVEEQKDIEL